MPALVEYKYVWMVPMLFEPGSGWQHPVLKWEPPAVVRFDRRGFLSSLESYVHLQPRLNTHHSSHPSVFNTIRPRKPHEIKATVPNVEADVAFSGGWVAFWLFACHQRYALFGVYMRRPKGDILMVISLAAIMDLRAWPLAWLLGLRPSNR
ncbi:hypothetical protein CNMCM5623_009486 [Aspergillus felis]|uniref:Uncharacterized protein n=1 Tax=Aspergillus felis TaxID=1287682 RepID=A0A8H6UTD7_9EURO|nr:hypothetical protein CNMCM5623_009486 [Aspergillus felis]KAF7181283.1 hypothetical protein CNMCM7691_000501 [Aspergillus felis]